MMAVAGNGVASQHSKYLVFLKASSVAATVPFCCAHVANLNCKMTWGLYFVPSTSPVYDTQLQCPLPITYSVLYKAVGSFDTVVTFQLNCVALAALVDCMILLGSAVRTTTYSTLQSGVD